MYFRNVKSVDDLLKIASKGTKKQILLTKDQVDAGLHKEYDPYFYQHRWNDDGSVVITPLKGPYDDYMGGDYDIDENIEPSEPEPDEDGDIFFGDERGKTIVSYAGKVIGKFDEEENARKFIKQWMEKEKYYPNVWFVSDHGNKHLVEKL